MKTCHDLRKETYLLLLVYLYQSSHLDFLWKHRQEGPKTNKSVFFLQFFKWWSKFDHQSYLLIIFTIFWFYHFHRASFVLRFLIFFVFPVWPKLYIYLYKNSLYKSYNKIYIILCLKKVFIMVTFSVKSCNNFNDLWNSLPILLRLKMISFQYQNVNIRLIRIWLTL